MSSVVFLESVFDDGLEHVDDGGFARFCHVDGEVVVAGVVAALAGILEREGFADFVVLLE